MTASFFTAVRFFPKMLMMLVLAFLAVQDGHATELEITGSPLQIFASENLGMRVLRLEDHFDTVNNVFTGQIIAERQYFSTYNTFIRRTLSGTTSVSGPGNFTPSPNEHVLVNVSGTGTTGTITSRVTTLDGISITQVVSYAEGQQVYQHTWTVTNASNSTFTGVALRYGGDSFFYFSDLANGFFDPALGMVFCRNDKVPGLMGMFGAANTPATHHFEDGFSANGTQLQSTGDLPDTVNPSFIDNGMSLQWDHGTLAPNESFTITAFEKWTDTGLVQVLAPSLTSANPGTTLNLSFTVQNLQNITDTFNLTAIASSGLTISAPTSIQLVAGGFASVPVQVIIGQGVAPGTQATVAMTAVAVSDGTLVNQDTARVNVISTPGAPIAFTAPTPADATIVSGSVPVAVISTDPQNAPTSLDLFLDANGTSTPIQHFTSGPFTATVDVSALASGTSITVRAVDFNSAGISSSITRVFVTAGGTAQGPVVTVTTPALGVSSGSTVVYNAICPATPEGLARLRAALTGRPSNQVRAFSWDAAAQTYAEVTADATALANLTIHSGVFIATRLNLGLDFSGAPASLPDGIVLKPGFNFVGLPPFLINSSGVTSHAFLADFSVALASDPATPITDPIVLADLLGTVGSGDLTTAQPFFWDGTAYTQHATLESGLGYWLKNNNTTTDVVLTRIDSSLVSFPAFGAVASATRNVGTGSQVVDRGVPPAPPGGSGKAQESGGGKACGNGAISAGLLLFGLLLLRVRQLRQS
ncbi:MAG: hypothetical protein H0X38_12450 [Planctomycetes bacterium]|nr:hypothetical protein [Planctomycetota bacterium]